MKPAMLTMTAFGPYAHTETIDFSALGANTLFLVCGETGSGKTAILDAMCFGLFGEASGRDRSGKSLRSDHAPADRPTAVTLEFILGADRYRVSRRPEQSKPKQRGEGFTRSPASATLEILQSNQWSVVATGGNAVGQQIEMRLGFGASQFRQLVVLPQGDFRSLLTAKSNEREAILARLFNTKRYHILQNLLDENAKKLKRTLEDADRERTTLLAHAEVENVDALQAILAEAKETLDSLVKRGLELNNQAGELRDLLEDARNVDRILKETKLAQQMYNELVKQQPEIDTDRQRLQIAEQAAELGDAERFLHDREQELADEQRLLKLAEANQLAAASAQQKAQQGYTSEEQREPERRAADQNLQRLVQWMESSDERLQAHEQAMESAREVAEIEKKLAIKQEHIGSLQNAVADARIALETTTTSAKMAEQLKATIQRLEQARADIATLAKGLTPGSPCPVCGSHEHPNPSTEATPKHDSELSTYQTQLEKTLHVAAGRLEAETRLQNTATRLQTTETEEKTLQQMLEQLRDVHRTASITRQMLLQELPEDLQAPGAIEDAHEKAEKYVLNVQEDWKRAQEQLHSAETKNKEAQVRFDLRQKALLLAKQRMDAQEMEMKKRIAEAGFSGTDAFQAAKLSAERRNQLKTKIEHWDQAMVATSDRLERAIKASAPLQPTNVPELEAQVDEAQKTANTHHNQTAAQRRDIDKLNGLLGHINEIDQAQAEQHSQYGVIGRLAEIANGKNAHRITFERFVQAELLDRILQAANLRFHPMTEGRYQLQRANNPQDRRRGAGLDLEVFDQNTGVARPAATLSGGEGFEACLALALGMADVVQAQSGGIHLDSIFVDEGFGSLGGQDLDRVIQALQSLQAGGRLVGVISHVGELGERIDARLVVHKSNDGSTTKFVVP